MQRQRLIFWALLPIALAIVGLLAGCATPGGGTLSPSQPSSAVAGQGFGAQNVGGDQGAGQTPQTVPGGQATQTWHFASLMPFETLMQILAAAKEQGWTAVQTTDAIKAASGAPQVVTITVGPMTVQGGSATATGATSGVGGTGAGQPPVSNR